MDTAKRGHYVNKGPLEFQQIDLDATSSSYSDSDDGESANSKTERSLSVEEEDNDLEIATEEPRKDEQLKKNGRSNSNLTIF